MVMVAQDDYDKIVNEKSKSKRILYLSSHCRSSTFVVLLLAIIRGDPFSDDWEPLLTHATIQIGNQQGVKLLLERGVDVFSIYDHRTPLERAIILNNLEMLCTITYYGGYHHIMFNGQSAFLYSIHCRCSMDIQKTLIDYEEDMNVHFQNLPTLFWAVSYESPIISDIIERGGDVNYFFEETNAISFCLWTNCSADIFKLLWERFDYEVWKRSYSKCVLLIFMKLSSEKSTEWRKSILEILMNNEEKLRLDIEHHNNSYFYHSDVLISDLFLLCLELNLPQKTINSYVIHMLSHGAFIFQSDLDKIYYNSPTDPTDFIDVLLFMDLRKSKDSEDSVSPMYFKYTLQPNLNEYLSNCRLAFGDTIDMEFMKRLKFIFHFDEEARNLVQDFDTSAANKTDILEDCSAVPSLLELSRNKLRKYICNYYKIKTVGLFHTLLNCINLPNVLQELLKFQRNVYNFSKL